MAGSLLVLSSCQIEAGVEQERINGRLVGFETESPVLVTQAPTEIRPIPTTFPSKTPTSPPIEVQTVDDDEDPAGVIKLPDLAIPSIRIPTITLPTVDTPVITISAVGATQERVDLLEESWFVDSDEDGVPDGVEIELDNDPMADRCQGGQSPYINTCYALFYEAASTFLNFFGMNHDLSEEASLQLTRIRNEIEQARREAGADADNDSDIDNEGPTSEE